jgi:hypothetical protein
MRAFITLLTFMLISMNTAFAAYKADVKTVRIPAGAKMSLQFLQTVNTYACVEGSSFNMMLLNEQKVGNVTVLPTGSVIRGYIKQVKQAKRLSRGAVLYLDFDHVVTPTGRQLPICLGVTGIRTITYDGGIYRTLGYGQAVKENWTKTCDITKVSANFGRKAKNVIAGSQYITTPICAIGGAIGGGFYFIGDSVADLFKKGEDVNLSKGSTLDVILTQPIDVPVN